MTPEPYDPNKPLYDAWGNKSNKELHETRKGNPVQNREGRFKFKKKVKKKFAEQLNQGLIDFSKLEYASERQTTKDWLAGKDFTKQDERA